MRILEKYTNPDGQLTLVITVGLSNELAIGFEGGEWHTHTDLLSHWLSVPEKEAINHFVDLVRTDRLPIILSVDGGNTKNPWISDDLPATLAIYGSENCIFRYWSGDKPAD